MTKSILVIALVSIFILSCNRDDNNTPTVTNPESVIISRPELFPEGITFDNNRKQFIVSSTTNNGTYTVADNGTSTALSTDPNMQSSYGLKADVSRNNLYVAGIGLGTDKAQFSTYNLTSGALVRSIDLGAVSANPNGRHVANDVCFDNNGNAYITDSYSPIIYRVTSSGVASVLITNPALNPSDPTGATFSFGLNGIEYVANGNYLLVSNYDFGTIHKISLDNIAGFSSTPVIDTNGNLDGMVLLPNGKIAVVSNGTEPANVLILSSTDNFNTATIEKTIALKSGVATTLTMRENDLYVIYSKLGLTSPQSTFEIGKVTY